MPEVTDTTTVATSPIGISTPIAANGQAYNQPIVSAGATQQVNQQVSTHQSTTASELPIFTGFDVPPPIQRQPQPVYPCNPQKFLQQSSIHAFMAKNVQLWLSLVDNFFQQAGITDDSLRVTLTTVKLDTDMLQLCSDILIHTEWEDRYTKLKERILQMHDKSRGKKLHDLFTGGTITAKRLSAMYRQMRELADPSYPDAVVRDLWYSKQEGYMQQMLFLQEKLTLMEVLQMADRAYEMYETHHAKAGNVDTVKKTTTADATKSEDTETDPLKMFAAAFIDFTKMLSDRSRPNSHANSRRSSRANSRAASRSGSPTRRR